jgi:hypothetical protein
LKKDLMAERVAMRERALQTRRTELKRIWMDLGVLADRQRPPTVKDVLVLLGLTGKAGSGKDTAYLELKKLMPEATKVGLADPLKDFAATILGLDRSLIDQYKEEGAQICIYENPWSCRGPHTISMRQLLQGIGQGARDLWGPDFWLNLLTTRVSNHNDSLYVVTDVRYDNEARRVKELGGRMVRIERPDQSSSPSEEEQAHASEQGVSDNLVDSVIINVEGAEYALGKALKALLNSK